MCTFPHELWVYRQLLHSCFENILHNQYQPFHSHGLAVHILCTEIRKGSLSFLLLCFLLAALSHSVRDFKEKQQEMGMIRIWKLHINKTSLRHLEAIKPDFVFVCLSTYVFHYVQLQGSVPIHMNASYRASCKWS